MSSTTAPETFSDLYNALLGRAREDATLTATIEQAKSYTNIGLLDMHIGFSEMLPWAERSNYIRTNPVYSTGTLAITVGTNTISGSGSFWATNNDYGRDNMRDGGKIIIAGDTNIYSITQVLGDALAGITPKYHGDTVTAATYTYYEDEYSLASDFLRPLDYRSFDDQRSISLIGRREFQRRYPRNDKVNRPRVATIIDAADPSTGDDTPTRRVRLYPAPDKAYLLPYSYVTKELAVSSAGSAQENLSADTDEPIVPKYARQAIVLKALSLWYRDKKDDTRSQEVNSEYVDLLTRVVGDQEIGSSRPQLRPRLGAYASRAQHPWGGPGGRYDVDGWFDRLEDRY